MPLLECINHRIRKDKQLKRKLAAYFDLSESSIYRLLYDNDDRFTQLGSLEIISQHYDYPDIHDLVESTVNATVL